jgi:DNA-binding transcriptional MerR regulator
MNNKNTDEDYMSITEFAEFAGISASSLRHYDRTGVFAPAKQGGKFDNNYRYYSPQQITTVKMIRVLTEIGVPLKIIKELSKNRTPEKLLKLLKKHRDKVAGELHFLREVYSVVDTFTELLYEAMSATETEITVCEMPEKRIILGDVNDFSGTAGFYREFIRFCSAPHEPKLNISYPVGGYWDSMPAFSEEPSRPARFFSLDPSGHEQRAAGLYLVGYTRGYYGQVNDLPSRMEAYAKKNGYVFTGAVYNIFLSDEISIVEPDRYLLQASVPVIETRRPSSRPHRHF